MEDVLSTANLDLAGAQIPREQVMHAPLPVARAVWMTPAGFAVRVANVTESATSLESVLSCQLMWALRHVARLRPGRVRRSEERRGGKECGGTCRSGWSPYH